MTAPYRDAVRLQTSILSASEKRLLVAIARRLPRWVTSDQLTLLAFVAMLLASVSFWLARFDPIGLFLVGPFLLVNWFGDSLDGTLARVRECQRPRYGFYVDHVIDAVGTLFLVGGMGLSGYMSGPVALALLVAYFLLMIEIYLATHVLGEFHMAFFGVGPTELRILVTAGALVLTVVRSVTVGGVEVQLLDLVGLSVTVGVVIAFVRAMVRNIVTLYRLEPLPQGRS